MKLLCTVAASFALFSSSALADNVYAPQYNTQPPASKTGDISAPYVEHGQMQNTAPLQTRDASPAEKVIQKVIDSPVRPTVIDGKPGAEYHGATQ